MRDLAASRGPREGRVLSKMSLGPNAEMLSRRIGEFKENCRGAGSLEGCFCISAFAACVYCFESRGKLFVPECFVSASDDQSCPNVGCGE